MKSKDPIKEKTIKFSQGRRQWGGKKKIHSFSFIS